MTDHVDKYDNVEPAAASDGADGVQGWGAGLSRIEFILALLVVLGVGHATYYLIAGLNNPLLDMYGFRQTQTAISTYWMLHGGPWLTYETPVLGAPWAIPFEFPIYQWIVAAITYLGVPLDAAGRLTSFFFFIATLAPAAMIFRSLGFARAHFLIFASLFVFSPLYVFWSRTFMIESTALFFGITWLAFIIRFSLSGSYVALGIGFLAGTIGILTKSTTFASFGLLGGIAIAVAFFAGLFAARKRGDAFIGRDGVIQFVVGGIVCVVVLTLGLAWVSYTDVIKAHNVLGEHVTSEQLKRFNYGTLEMRASGELWKTAMLDRTLPQVLGPLFLAGLVALLAAFVRKRHAVIAGVGLVGALVPIMIFTNLHRVHAYYQYANAVFLIAAIAIGISALWVGRWRIPGVLLLMVLLGSETWMFHQYYRPVVEEDLTARSRYRTGLAVRELTEPGEAVFVFGDDWSSETLYYSQRKGVAFPGFVSPDEFRALLEEPSSHLGGAMLGAVVSCGSGQQGDKGRWIEQFLSERALLQDLGGCQIYSPDAVEDQSAAVVADHEIDDDDLRDVCRLFGVAAGRALEEVDDASCGFARDGDELIVRLPLAGQLGVSIIESGDTFVPTEAFVTSKTNYDAATDTWGNIGMVFIGKAGRALCMDVDYIAEDATSDSVFVLRHDDDEPTVMGFPSQGPMVKSQRFGEAVVSEGEIAAFAVYAREPRTRVKSISFDSCPTYQ